MTGLGHYLAWALTYVGFVVGLVGLAAVVCEGLYRLAQLVERRIR